ncbi:serine/threonine-protein kinase [Sorangium sp. So ce375]|uniref:serine/threonine protein kinase n=1 Tax=Sorangium sp. So ce375 TaxID=3133306 RepID=UPI003F5BA5C5
MATTFGKRWRSTGKAAQEGGQAHVFEVVDLQAADQTATFALKRLKKAQDPNRVARFKQEVEALRILDHPNIIKIHDDGVDGDKPFYVTDYYSRGTLEQHVERIAQDPPRTLLIFAKICDGIGAAHQKGIIHRDIKPENVLLAADDEPIVTDFGLCHMKDTDRQTQMKEAVGARWYMAPELAHGRASDDKITPRCDVYSLGKLLYNMLSNDIFDREEHRSPGFELVNRTGNEALEHVNRILDVSIVHDPAGRCKDATELAHLARAASSLIAANYRVVRPLGLQLCTFCGVGRYLVKERGFVENTNYSGQEWRFLVCDQCGHMHQFRIEKAARKKDWWGA